MNVLLVYAHPEPRSLNGSLKDFAVQRLQHNGHAVQVSDLYAMKWKAALNADDNTAHPSGERFAPARGSRLAYTSGTQSPDVMREQEKLRWADAVILQFPLWWYSMPAILKGWVERVYAYGFAYGVGEHSDTHWGDRYGEGKLAGKRAMLSVTIGGYESHYAPRGVNGAIDDILFPIQHGILFYPGFDVLPPHVIYRADRFDPAAFPDASEAWGLRLDDLWTTTPIRFQAELGRLPASSRIDAATGTRAGAVRLGCSCGTRLSAASPGQPSRYWRTTPVKRRMWSAAYCWSTKGLPRWCCKSLDDII